MPRTLSRRAALASLAALPALAAKESADKLRLGIASYSFRKFSRAQAIAMAKQLNTPYLNLKSFHLPYDSTPAQFQEARREFADAGIQIVGGGTIDLKKDDDADIRKYFDYAKAAGMPLMVIAPTQETMPRIERFVKEYDIKAAIHNHGPEDKYFPAPADALKVVKDMDPRCGLCIDIGHTARTGTDPVAAIRQAGPRLLDMHVKDLKDLSNRESQCDVGDGKMPIPAIFAALLEMGYAGCVNLEYEINADDPLPGMERSFAFMRRTLKES